MPRATIWQQSAKTMDRPCDQAESTVRTEFINLLSREGYITSEIPQPFYVAHKVNEPGYVPFVDIVALVEGIGIIAIEVKNHAPETICVERAEVSYDGVMKPITAVNERLLPWVSSKGNKPPPVYSLVVLTHKKIDENLVARLNDTLLRRAQPSTCFRHCVTNLPGQPTFDDYDYWRAILMGFLPCHIRSGIEAFDDRQLKAQSIPKRDERIRGVAGSGKSVVLAIKVALTALAYPDKRILVATWNLPFAEQTLTPSILNWLRHFHKDSNTEFSVCDLRDSKCVEETIHLASGWTFLRLANETAYRNIRTNIANCNRNDTDPTPGNSTILTEAWAEMSEIAVEKTNQERCYDYIFVDEGQSYSSLCDGVDGCIHPVFGFLRSLLKPEGKLVVAYDEGQMDSGFRVPSVLSTFGRPHNQVERIVLKSCYRCATPTLMIAHALLWGLHRTAGRLHGPRTPNGFNEVGYTVSGSPITTISRECPPFIQCEETAQSFEVLGEIDWQERITDVNGLQRALAQRQAHCVIIPLDTDGGFDRVRQEEVFSLLEESGAAVSSRCDWFTNTEAAMFTAEATRARGSEFDYAFVFVPRGYFEGAAIHEQKIRRVRLFISLTRARAKVFLVTGCDLLRTEVTGITRALAHSGGEKSKWTLTLPGNPIAAGTEQDEHEPE